MTRLTPTVSVVEATTIPSRTTPSGVGHRASENHFSGARCLAEGHGKSHGKLQEAAALLPTTGRFSHDTFYRTEMHGPGRQMNRQWTAAGRRQPQAIANADRRYSSVGICREARGSAAPENEREDWGSVRGGRHDVSAAMTSWPLTSSPCFTSEANRTSRCRMSPQAPAFSLNLSRGL